MTIDDLQRIMSTLFDVSPDDICEETTIDDISSWDSIRHVDLIIELEKKTGERLKAYEIVTLTSVSAILSRFS